MVGVVRGLPGLILLGSLLLPCRGAAGTPAPADTLSPGEEQLPRFRVVDPTVSQADRMTLREIIDRSVEGEKGKLAGHRDMTYTLTLRSILSWKKKREIHDEIIRIYEDDKGTEKRIRLLEKVEKQKLEDDRWVQSEEDENEGRVTVEADRAERGENLSHVPFFLRNQEDYEFTLLERNLENDHVIFKIAFKPRSTFKPLPSGTVYVDTDAFRVIHEEFHFDQNPVPLLLKDVERISRHWTRLPEGEWVVSRMSAVFTLQGSWMGVLPERVEVGITFSDYAFDRGYDPRVFGPKRGGDR